MTADKLVMVRDGESECGVLVTLGAFGPKAVVAHDDATPHVKMACSIINGLVKNGVDFEALVALAPDSPRVGDVLEQIRDRLEPQPEDEPAARGPAPIQGETDAQ
jgi:hypothetical protein